MKNAIIIISIICCLWACNNANTQTNSDNEDNNDKLSKEKPVGEVSITISPESYNIEDLNGIGTLRMTNNTDEEIMTGEAYSIEYSEKGNWTHVEAFKDISFISIGYLLKKGNTKEFPIQFYADKHPYKKGTYRIVKYYVLNKDQAPKTSHNAYAKFSID